MQTLQNSVAPSEPRDIFAPRRLDKTILTHMATGLIIALIVFWVPLFSIVFLGMITLIHEMGHAACAFLIGRPALPAFDFQYGGGVTGIFARNNWLLVLIYGIVAWLFFVSRRNKFALAVLLPLVCLHALLVFTKLGDQFISTMGHGTELIIAGVFLYRGWAGRSILNPLERPLYSALGQFIVLKDAYFAFLLMTSVVERAQYLQGKGNIHANDFVLVARGFGVDLSTVAFLFLLCCALPPVLSFLAWRYETRMWWLLQNLLPFNEE
jgi:hypothetical protein